MLRAGLVFVFAVSLLPPGKPPASMDESTSANHAGSGMTVCSIDPTWGIILEDPTHDTNWDVRVPAGADLDPAFEVRVPCFHGNGVADAGSRNVRRG